MSSYEVDAATMCDALSFVWGVEHVVLEFDDAGGGVLRVQVADDQNQAAVVEAAIRALRHRFGLDVDDDSRLRLTGPTGRPVVAVVEALPAAASAKPGSRNDIAATQYPAPTTSVDPEPEPPTQPRHTSSARVVVERIVVATERAQVSASVELRSGQTLHEGAATRPATGDGVHRALASATASAVESVVSSSTRLEVEQVDLLAVGSDHVAVVVLSLLAGAGIERLTGSALVRSDSRDAVVRATLDALNRRAGLADVR